MTGIKSLVAAIIGAFNRVPDWFLQLFARMAIFYTFWNSGRNKLSCTNYLDPGCWEPNTTTFYLFTEGDFALPFLPGELAAWMATLAENILPVFLIIGLASRFSALGLLIMTLIIQFFVMTGWQVFFATHILWMLPLLYIIARGPGILSLDHLLFRNR